MHSLGYQPLIIIDTSLSATVIKGAVSFISQPRNQTVKEGEAVRFECAYQGSDLTPAWRINNSIYSHTQLPAIYDFNDQDFSLTVSSAPGSLNFTSFQCIVGTIFSNQGYLFIEVEQQYTTNCVQCSALTTTSAVENTTELITTGAFRVFKLTLTCDYFERIILQTLPFFTDSTASSTLSTVNNSDLSHLSGMEKT